MNELNRQHYLSALGIDTYMPRWQLSYAPDSIACKLSATPFEGQLQIKSELKDQSVIVAPLSQYTHQHMDIVNPIASPVSNLMGDMLESKKTIFQVAKQSIQAADILAQLDNKPVSIDAFSLSIWRPIDNVMIVDSRNSKLALPTELLLNNIVCSIFSNPLMKPKEEILRWPMIENSFTKRTANDARGELQTWLSVQQEIRPIHYLWLMGSNAAKYLLPEHIDNNDCVFQSTALADSDIRALVTPSLIEILQNPRDKQKLFTAIRRYHSVSL